MQKLRGEHLTTIISCDQSMAKAFFTVWVDGSIVDKFPVKTGSSDAKKKLKSASYFKTTPEQIHHICDKMIELKEKHKPDLWVFEALSFGSGGNQEKNLAALFGAIVERLFVEGVPKENIKTFAPTTVKSFARTKLPEGRQTVVNDKGKLVKIKMGKAEMIEAARNCLPKEYFEGYKLSGEHAGLDDLCDSYFLLQLGIESLK